MREQDAQERAEWRPVTQNDTPGVVGTGAPGTGMPWRCLWPVGPDLPWILSVGGDGAVGGFLPWSERPLREVSLASCAPPQRAGEAERTREM